MRGVKQFVGILSLASLALWFALSFGTAFASGQASQPAAEFVVLPLIRKPPINQQVADL